jgi:hypothetical protein
MGKGFITSMAYEYSSHTLLCLTEAGWQPGRSVDTSPYETYIKQNGYTLNDSAIEFWREFGGLFIPLDVPQRHPSNVIRIDFTDIGSTYPEICQAYGEFVHDDLSPIGTLYECQQALYVAKSGRVYSSNEEWFGLIGEHGADAIDNLCTDCLPLEEYEIFALPTAWFKLDDQHRK